ncbi:hypothetical protein [Sphingobium aromaticiconvertens]|uniref:hypothetical protein n=1 Tax=Sphingobium aromaticiconvertens TaxID=365341 RepID=UPI003019D6EF
MKIIENIGGEISPIFLHSSFRTGSTWVWSKFRSNSECYCYYEVFNEILQTINFKNILQSASTWNSHHPAGAPYFSEFSPLLDKVKGIKGFDERMSFADFFLDLNDDEDRVRRTGAYLSSLVSLAQQNGRIPVLSCTRSIGRVKMIKSHIGGTHILIKRRLLNQWFSYSNQAQNLNPYFFRTIIQTVQAKDADNFIITINNLLTENDFNQDSLNENHDTLLIAFLCLHIYLNFKYKDNFDIILDLTKGVSNSDLNADIQMILDHTSVQVDLFDYSDIISAPQKLIGDIDRVFSMVRSLFAQGIAGLNDDALRNVVDSELADFREGYEQYCRIAGSAHLQLEIGDAARMRLETQFNTVTEELTKVHSSANQQLEELTAQLKAASGELESIVPRLQAAELTLQQEHAHRQSLSDQLSQATGQVQQLQQELEQNQTHYGALERRCMESEQARVSIEAAMQVVQERCSALEQDVQQEVSRAATLSAQLEAAEGEATTVAQNLQETELALQHERARHQSLSDQMTLVNEQVQRLQQELKQSQTQYGVLELRCMESEQARISVETAIQVAQERCSVLECDVQRADRALEQQWAETQQVLAELEFIVSGEAEEKDAFERHWSTMIKRLR